jgi:hypothetical protein
MKIRGNTVGTPLTPKAALLKAELTEEEKVQARERIGAAAIGEGGGGVSDEHINDLIDAKLGVIENGTY